MHSIRQEIVVNDDKMTNMNIFVMSNIKLWIIIFMFIASVERTTIVSKASTKEWEMC